MNRIPDRFVSLPNCGAPWRPRIDWLHAVDYYGEPAPVNRLPPPPSAWDRVHMGGLLATCERCGEQYVRGGRIGLLTCTAPADCACATLPPPPPVPAEAREVALTVPPPRYYGTLADDLRALELVYGCCARCGARPDEACDALCGDDTIEAR